MGPRAVERRNPGEILGGLIPHARFTTVIILLINTALYIAEYVSPQAGISEFGRSVPAAYMDGQWWRLVTAGFLHGNILHILMNSWVLFDLIAEVEQFYGTARLIVVYVLSSVAGFYVSFFFNPGTVSMGASAACFGLIGVMLALGMSRSHPMALMIRSYYKRWAIYGIIFSFIPGMRIDFTAHLGGLAGGFLLGLIMGLPKLPNSPVERLWRIVAIAVVALTVYAFVQDFRMFALLTQEQ
jgi:rhomboid protease GluP